MIHVKVLLFAIIRDAARTGEVDIALPATATAQDAIASVESRFPEIAKYLPRAAIAVNRQYASAETRLADGDELAILPPVSGG